MFSPSSGFGEVSLENIRERDAEGVWCRRVCVKGTSLQDADESVVGDAEVDVEDLDGPRRGHRRRFRERLGEEGAQLFLEFGERGVRRQTRAQHVHRVEACVPTSTGLAIARFAPRSQRSRVSSVRFGLWRVPNVLAQVTWRARTLSIVTKPRHQFRTTLKKKKKTEFSKGRRLVARSADVLLVRACAVPLLPVQPPRHRQQEQPVRVLLKTHVFSPQRSLFLALVLRARRFASFALEKKKHNNAHAVRSLFQNPKRNEPGMEKRAI